MKSRCAERVDDRSDGRNRTATVALQTEIDARHARGGGRVRIAPGVHVIGTLYLRDQVVLDLEPGAVLQASARKADYRDPHLIVAAGCRQVGIVGQGIIDGNAQAFFEPDVTRPAGFRKKEWAPQPLLEFVDCHNVMIEGITIRQAPRWTLHLRRCAGATIRGIAIHNDPRHANTDGIDINSSRNIRIADCDLVCGDDCIVLKTAGPPAAARPLENVTVTNCTMVSSTSALKLGTESFAPFRHCVFSNCVIRNSRTGIALLCKDGGTMEAVHFDNITIETRPKHGIGHSWPIILDSEKRYPDSKPGVIRDVTLRGIMLHTAGRVLVQGQPTAPIENLLLDNITLRFTGYEKIAGARKLQGGRRANPEVLDLGDKPAALIFAHIHGLRLRHVQIIWPPATARAAPHRAALYSESVTSADYGGLEGQSNGGKE